MNKKVLAPITTIIAIATIIPVGVSAYGPLTLPFADQEYSISTEWSEEHTGIDYDTPNDGDPIPVVASASGDVVDWEDGWDNDPGCLCYGNYVKIDHGDDLETLYGHLKKYTLSYSVENFLSVQQGEEIAKENNSGWSSGDHVHFESRINGTSVDPYSGAATSTDYLWTTDPPTLSSSWAQSTTTVSGTISSNTTWASSTVYIIDGTVTINSGVTLTIDPGTIIKFKTASSNLYVNGTLDADGTSSEKIHFTSFKDDTLGGDSNGAGGSPDLGDWASLRFSNTASSTMDHVVIRYGGYNGCCSLPSAAVYNDGGDLTFTNADIVQSSTKGFQQNSGTTSFSSTSVIHNNGSDGIRVDGGTLSISNSTIYANTDQGVYGAGSGSLTLTGNAFYDNGQHSIFVDGSSGLSFTHSSNTASGDGTRGIVMYGNISNNQTWTTDSIPYVIATLVSIDSGKTLTINPGVVVKFSSTSAGMTVNGTLDAEGSSGSKIYFTSIKDNTVGGDTNYDSSATSPAASDWGRINVGSTGASTFDYAVIKYGGYSTLANLENNGGFIDIFNSELATGTQYAIWNYAGTTTADYLDVHGQTNAGLRLENGAMTVTSSMIHDNAQYGIYAAGSGTFTFFDNTFSDNDTVAVSIDNGNGISFSNYGNTASGDGKRGIILYNNITENQTWSADDMPYIVNNSVVTINSGKKVTIAPDVIIKFDGSSARIRVSGELDVQGTEGNEVYFTSIKDDTVGGDTNGDGGGTTPAASNWASIQGYNVSASSTIDHAVIRYGGASEAAIYNSYGTMNLLNTEIATSSKAIWIETGTTTGEYIDLHGHSYAIRIDGGNITVNNSYFHNNSSLAIDNETVNTMDATYNYWNASDGPSGSGLPGSGEAIYGPIDYSNFLTSWP